MYPSVGEVGKVVWLSDHRFRAAIHLTHRCCPYNETMFGGITGISCPDARVCLKVGRAIAPSVVKLSGAWTQVKAEREAPDDIEELQRLSVEHHAETHADETGVRVEELIEEETVMKKVTRSVKATAPP